MYASPQLQCAYSHGELYVQYFTPHDYLYLQQLGGNVYKWGSLCDIAQSPKPPLKNVLRTRIVCVCRRLCLYVRRYAKHARLN